jgi:hypothetical protein
MNAQTTTAVDSIGNGRNVTLPSLSYISFNASNLLSNKYSQNFSNVKGNTNYRSIKEGFFVLSKEAIEGYDQFDYEVFKYTPADALRRITPNYDLHSAPLPSPTYYSVD